MAFVKYDPLCFLRNSNTDQMKQEMLAGAVKAVLAGQKIIIFCQSLAKLSLARDVFDEMIKMNSPASDPQSTICHAQLEDDTKATNFGAWKAGNRLAMFSTLVLAMGINVLDLRLVVLLTPPSTLVEFYQEICRGGRDLSPCDCVVYVPNTLLGIHWKRSHKGIDSSMQSYLVAIMGPHPKVCSWALLAQEFMQNAPDVVCGRCEHCTRGANPDVASVQQDAANASAKRSASRKRPSLPAAIVEEGDRGLEMQEMLKMTLKDARDRVARNLGALPHEICSEKALQYLVTWEINTEEAYQSVVGASKHFWPTFQAALQAAL